jgi:hypothetical protein
VRWHIACGFIALKGKKGLGIGVFLEGMHVTARVALSGEKGQHFCVLDESGFYGVSGKMDSK